MEQRLSLITLGVADLDRAVKFYGDLGWKPANDHKAQDVAFFQGIGGVIALWNREELAKDSEVEDTGGWGGVGLAYNVNSAEEVDEVLAEAEKAGARIGRTGSETPWGGYSGIFIDSDGHPWEVAHNPEWGVNDDGSVTI